MLRELASWKHCGLSRGAWSRHGPARERIEIMWAKARSLVSLSQLPLPAILSHVSASAKSHSTGESSEVTGTGLARGQSTPRYLNKWRP